MIASHHDARCTGARTPDGSMLLQLSIATALAAGMLLATSIADARTTKIEITSRTIAFGGYSFDGVGQYEKITGIATGEVDPTDPRNAVIVDIALAPRLADGNCPVPAQFLHPEAARLEQGQSQGDVRAAQSGRQDVRRRSTAAPAATIRAARYRSRPCLRTRSCGRAATRRCGADGKTTLGPSRLDRDGRIAGRDTVPAARRSPAPRTNTS